MTRHLMREKLFSKIVSTHFSSQSLAGYLAETRQDIGEMLPIPLVSLTPGYKIVKRTSSNTVRAAYVNGYKLPPLYPSAYDFLIDS